ncbi:MAG: glutamate racemase [Bdellovibrionales bacterium]
MSEIGVFDSGLGGLTVLRALKSALPQENFVYLGDTARLPYGSKSQTTIRRYVEQNIDYLYTQKIKAVVVACNSASTVIRQQPIESPIPIFEVIQPGAETALKNSSTKRIGVVGTWATISQNAYADCLHSLEPQAQVFQQACPLLVPLVEEGWTDDPMTNLVIHRYIGGLIQQGIDTLILGCTHYPALINAFRKVVGPNIHLTDSADAMAQKLKAALIQGEIASTATGSPGKIRLLTTDTTARFAEIAARLLGVSSAPHLDVVDINS